MKVAVRACAACGVDARPAPGAATPVLDRDGAVLSMPYQCQRGHRFVARIVTRRFEPQLPGRR